MYRAGAASGVLRGERVSSHVMLTFVGEATPIAANHGITTLKHRGGGSRRSELAVKDRHQWLGREFRGSLSLNMDKLFLKAIIYKYIYHQIAND